VTGRQRDRRDERSEAIQEIVKRALGVDPEVNPTELEPLLPPGSIPPLTGWPSPTVESQHLARLAVTDARSYVPRAAKLLGLERLASRSRRVPAPRLEFGSDAAPSQIVFWAPLIYECLEDDAKYELGVLALLLYSPKTRALTNEGPLDDELASLFGNRASLTRRLNGYLELEANLWWLAREGGFRDPPPYAVRYESARWLWSPDISGLAFCLRCGAERSFRRAKREGSSRTLRCVACSRGAPSDWPAHAIAPHDHGRWWLVCQRVGCANAFVGRRHAMHCPEHRSARLTASRRKTRHVSRSSARTPARTHSSP
jgi:hypothetical protein